MLYQLNKKSYSTYCPETILEEFFETGHDILYFVFSVAQQPSSGQGLLMLKFLDLIQFDTHTLGRTPLSE